MSKMPQPLEFPRTEVERVAAARPSKARPTVKRVNKLGKNSAKALKWTLKASRLKRQAEKEQKLKAERLSRGRLGKKASKKKS